VSRFRAAACELGAAQLGPPLGRLDPRVHQLEFQPVVDVSQGRGVHLVETPGSGHPNGGENAVPQHLQVLGDGGLGDAELALDGLGG